MRIYSKLMLILPLLLFTIACDDKDKDVNLGDHPVAAFSNDKQEYSLGDIVILLDESTPQEDIVEYYWHFGFDGVGNNSTEQNTSIAYSKAGTYVVKLTVTNKFGLDSTQEKQILVRPINTPPVVDFDSGSLLALTNVSIEFKDMSSDNGEVVAWAWDFGDGATSSEQNPTHTFTTAGFVVVKLTVTDDQDVSATRSKQILVKDTITPGVFSILWSETFEAASSLRSVSPAVGDNGDIYVVSNALKLYSYSPLGAKNWEFNLAKSGATGNQESSPMVDADGTIYIGAGYGSSSSKSYLYAVNSNGTQKWEFLVGAGARIAYTSPVLTADGSIAIGNRGTGGSLKVVNQQGGLSWTTTPAGGVGGALAADKLGNVYNGSTGTRGFGISNAGKVVGNDDYLGVGLSANATNPAIDESGNIYVLLDNGSSGVLMAYSSERVKKWEFTTAGRGTQGGVVIGSDGTIYVGSYGGTLHALTSGGTEKWSHSVGADISSVPAVDNQDNIHVTDESGNYTIVGSDGTRKHQVSLGTKIWSSPVISDYGLIYVTVEDGTECKLIAIDYGITSPANSPWPQKGQNAKRNALQK